MGGGVMGVVIAIGGRAGGDAPLMMSPAQFARMAAAMQLHPSHKGAVCEICGQTPDGDEFAIVDVSGVSTWVCDPCGYEFGDCGLCDVPHHGRPCPVDAS